MPRTLAAAPSSPNSKRCSGSPAEDGDLGQALTRLLARPDRGADGNGRLTTS